MNANETLPEKKGFPWGWVVVLLSILAVPVALVVNVRDAFADKRKRSVVYTDAQNLLMGMARFKAEFKTLPDGDDAQFLAALSGMNPTKTVFMRFDTNRLNARGQFLDPWGHPYHIDVSDPKSPAVYSIGKNGIDEGGALDSDDLLRRW